MSHFDTMHLKLVVSDYWDSADFYKSLGKFFLTFVKDSLLTVLLGHGEKKTRANKLFVNHLNSMGI